MPTENTKIFIYQILALLALGAALALGLVVAHFVLAKAEIVVIANQVPVHVESNITIPINNISEPLISSGQAILPGSTISAGITDALAPAATSDQPIDSKKTDDLERLRQLILNMNPGAETAGEPVPATSEVALEVDPAELQPLAGELYILNLKVEHSIVPQGESTTLEAQATGTITLFNESRSSQALVASTRLQTPEGVVVRIKKAVTVPAGGSIKTEAQADPEFKGAAGNIAPTTLTLPGLAASRQKVIYGKNEEPFKGGVQVLVTLSASDFTRAETEARQLLQDDALRELNNLNQNVPSANLRLEDVQFSSPDQPGEQKTSLEIVATGKAKAMVFDTAPLLHAAKEKLFNSLPPDQTILAYNKDSLQYEIINVDETSKTALLKVYLEGFATLSDGNSLIDARDLVGLRAEDVEAQLLKNKAVQSVEVKFSPFWVTRTPLLIDKIHLTIQPPSGEK